MRASHLFVALVAVAVVVDVAVHMAVQLPPPDGHPRPAAATPAQAPVEAAAATAAAAAAGACTDSVQATAAARPAAVLVATIARDERSFGAGRTVRDHVALVESLEFPAGRDLALLSSDDALEAAARATGAFRTVVRWDSDSGVGRSDASRHADQAQQRRRSVLAQARNYLLFAALEPHHTHVLWIDADIERIPRGIVADFAAAGAAIVTPMCVRGDPPRNYDLNAWGAADGDRAHVRTKPGSSRYRGYVPRPAASARHLDAYARAGKDRADLVAVGATVLWVDADVFRRGALFPPYYAIGALWETAGGYDGIESEGLCYVAEQLGAGYRCVGLPLVEVVHNNT